MRALAVGVVMMFLTSCIDDDGNDAGDLQSGSAEYTSYTRTRNPIVLIPGLLGFDDVIGVVHYFEGVPAALEEGGATVFVAQTSQAASATTIGEQLIPQLEQFLAESGATKLNLFGHSAGAQAARYVAAVRPDLVASVTSIGGSHQGSPVADFLAGDTFGTLDETGLQVIADMLGMMSGSAYPNDVSDALSTLSTTGAAAFNAQYPAAVPVGCGEGQAVVDGIPYFSWGGTSPLTNPIDPSDLFLVATSALITGPSDGLVPRCSNHLGKVLRDDYPQNHMDEVNLLFGMVSFTGPQPKSLYRQQANRLKNAGL